MSWKVTHWVSENSPAKGTQLLLLLLLADIADDKGFCWPSLRTLEYKSRMSRRAVQQLISSLENEGLLTVQRGDGRESSRYWIDMTKQREDLRSESRGADSTPLRSESRGADSTPQGCSSYDTPGVHGSCSDRSVTVIEQSLNPPPVRKQVTAKLSVQPEEEDSLQENSKTSVSTHPDTDRVLEAVSKAWGFGQRGRTTIRGAVSGALAASWSASDLIRVLSTNTGGVKRPTAVILARLQDLPDQDQKTPTITPKCDACNPSRWIEDPETGYDLHKCPTCHPTHQLKEAS
jgi:Helix-turn-helix domain